MKICKSTSNVDDKLGMFGLKSKLLRIKRLCFKSVSLASKVGDMMKHILHFGRAMQTASGRGKEERRDSQVATYE